MSLAEELLNTVSEEVPVHVHPVPDTDTYFVIDPITRKIENTNTKKNVIMQYDHNSERFTFELPRYIDGHDMLECNSVTVNVDNVEATVDETMVPRINPDAPDITDLRVHPSDPEKVICSWLISRNSTQLAGILSFHIEYKCVDVNGNVVYEWSTDDYDEIEVKARKKNGEAAVIEYSDVLEQWRASIFGAGDSVMENIATEGETQLAAVKAESETQQEAVELKGALTLGSIPEDYTRVDAMAEEAVRSKSDAIVCEDSGENIAVNDSSNDYIRGLKLFGKSSQVTTNGHQLFDASKLASFTTGGATVNNNGDGSFTIAGTGALTELCGTSKAYTHEETVAILKKFGTVYLANNVTTVPYIYVAFWRGGTAVAEVTNRYNKTTSAVITEDMFNDETFTMRIGFYGFAGDDIVATTVKPMLYMDGDGTWEPFTGGMPAPSPEYPQKLYSVGTDTPVTVKIIGKNLLNNIANSYTHNGVTFKKNADGSITVTGTATATTTNHLTTSIKAKEGETYILTGCPADNPDGKIVLRCFNPDNSGMVYDDVGEGVEFQFNNADGLHNISIVIFNGTTVNTTFYPMLRHKSIVDSTYEPYIEQSIVINRDIPGIPVTSGGNYTDPNGQQWICDEVDFERGVYIQRVKKIVLDGSNKFDIAKNHDNSDRYLYTVYSLGINTGIDGRGYCSSLQYNTANTMNAPGANTIETSGYSLSNSYSVLYLNLGYLMTENSVEALREMLAANPITFFAALKSPIETPLTAEEISAFKALRTNYSSTTILNDAGAWMSVKYNADTKTYVENPKTLKLVDSSTGVVYELKIVDGSLTVTQV